MTYHWSVTLLHQKIPQTTYLPSSNNCQPVDIVFTLVTYKERYLGTGISMIMTLSPVKGVMDRASYLVLQKPPNCTWHSQMRFQDCILPFTPFGFLTWHFACIYSCTHTHHIFCLLSQVQKAQGSVVVAYRNWMFYSVTAKHIWNFSISINIHSKIHIWSLESSQVDFSTLIKRLWRSSSR